MQSILFISLMNSDPWGGSEVQWFSLAKYCLEKKISVSCLLYDWKEKKKYLEDLEKEGATIFFIPNKGRAKKDFLERLRFEWITRLQQKIFIKKFNFSTYDFVVVNQGGFMEVTNNPWKHVYTKLKSYCLTYHNYTLNFTFKPEKAKLLKAWIKNAHINIGDAERIKEVLEKQLEIEISNFKAIVNPLTIEKANVFTNYPSLQNGNFKIIMLAQLDVSRKAQDNLIKVFALPQWQNRNAILEIYGDGEHYQLLKSLIYQNNLSEKVFLKGNTKEVAKVIESSHLVLQITHRDAMPISVVEAMSKSRAVVVSDVGDMPLWIRNDFNGWVSPSASELDIANVLEIAWSKKENWEQMGKNAFDTFTSKYPISVAEEFFTLISKK